MNCCVHGNTKAIAASVHGDIIMLLQLPYLSLLLRSESTLLNTKRMHNTWTAAIREVSCYYGIMGSETAEKMLKRTQSDSHLIRCSDSNGEYILSVLKRGANGPICQHFIIKTKLHDSSLYTVEGSDMTFHDVHEMLKYFRKNPISSEINNIGISKRKMPSKTISAEPSWKFPSTTKISTITELSCYHGALRGVEAEEKLKQQPGDSHLIRYSDSNEEYILSVLMRDDNGPICQHFIIKTLPPPHDKYSCTVEGSDRVFHCASEMLKYFREHPISYEIYSIGKPCNHNHSKATHHSSVDDSDISDDWISTRLTPPLLVTKPQRSRSF